MFFHWNMRFTFFFLNGFSTIALGFWEPSKLPGRGYQTYRGTVESGGGAWVSGRREFRSGLFGKSSDVSWMILGNIEGIVPKKSGHHHYETIMDESRKTWNPRIGRMENRQQPYFMGTTKDVPADFTLNKPIDHIGQWFPACGHRTEVAIRLVEYLDVKHHRTIVVVIWGLDIWLGWSLQLHPHVMVGLVTQFQDFPINR